MKVFLTYSHKDQALAREVVDTLRDAGLDVWYDMNEIFPGDNWAEKISQGLKESNAMVVLLTPNSLESNSVSWNISYALGDQAYSHRLISVIVGDPKEFPHDKIPWILKRLKMINLPDQDRRKEGLGQIVAVLKAA